MVIAQAAITATQRYFHIPFKWVNSWAVRSSIRLDTPWRNIVGVGFPQNWLHSNYSISPALKKRKMVFICIKGLQAGIISSPLYTFVPVNYYCKILHDLSRNQNQILKSFQKSTFIVHYMWCTIRWFRITLLNFVFCEKNHNVIYYEQVPIFNKTGRNHFCVTSKNMWHGINRIFKELWAVLRVIGKIRKRLIK